MKLMIFYLKVAGIIIIFGTQDTKGTVTKLSSNNVTLYLYTWMNPNKPHRISTANVLDVLESNFEREKKSYFLFHDRFRNYTSSELNKRLKNPLMNTLDINLFLADYNGPGSLFEYHDQAIVEVGTILAKFINQLASVFTIPLSQIVLIGFGIGAHVAGEIGRNLNGNIGMIIALDPSSMTPPNVYIGPNRANFVQVVHTSHKGLLSALGHADYYPNTAHQPGCKRDTECSHLRAVIYYEESLNSGGFTASRCTSREAYLTGLCDDNHVSYIGGYEIDTE